LAKNTILVWSYLLTILKSDSIIILYYTITENNRALQTLVSFIPIVDCCSCCEVENDIRLDIRQHSLHDTRNSPRHMTHSSRYTTLTATLDTFVETQSYTASHDAFIATHDIHLLKNVTHSPHHIHRDTPH
jgi:hypothetical protein